MATNNQRGEILGKATVCRRVEDVWADSGDESKNPWVQALVHTYRDNPSEDVRNEAEDALFKWGYFDGRMTRSRLIQGELFSEEEMR